MRGDFLGTYYMYTTATIGIYTKKAGVWSRATTTTAYAFGEYYSAGPHTFPFYLEETYQLGTGIEAFGVAVEEVNGYGSATAQVTDLASVSWSSVGSSGVTSATPDGQQTTVTVRPV